MRALLAEVRACRLCAEHLPLGPRPILAAAPSSRVLVVGQAPGARVHASGVPWQDASGDRLREWMGIDAETFYDARRVALVPMGFCYPGKQGAGDAPPRPECAHAWHARLLEKLEHVELTLLIGAHAQAYYLGAERGATLTETVRRWKTFGAARLPLPHPSPRNTVWMHRNPWFADEVLPTLRRRCRALLAPDRR